jgi:tRNA-dihydrouridine synthase
MLGMQPAADQTDDFSGCSLAIGSVVVPNRVVLAPLSGITDAPFRQVADGSVRVSRFGNDCLRGLGAGRTRGKRSQRGFCIHVVQLAGCEARWMAEGARIVEAQGAQIVDINMGCPAKRVTNGASGSALMRDLDHA